MAETSASTPNQPLDSTAGASPALTAGESVKAQDPPKGGSSDATSTVIAVIWIVALSAGIIGGIIKGVFGIGEPRLEIVAAAQQNQDTRWFLSGRILFKGEPVKKPTVWAIVADDRGNRFSPIAVTNGPYGEFQISGIPAILSGTNQPKSLEAMIYAKQQIVIEQNKPAKWIEGKEVLALGEHGGTRWVELPLWAILPLLCVFVGSIVLALMRSQPNGWGVRVKYYGCVGLALVLTFAMIGYISMGLRRINLSGTKGEVVALGFANIFYGTYVKETDPEWLLSLTAPAHVAPTAAPGGVDLVRGFGAPLWVLFMSVIGSGIFTLLIVIRGIKEPVNFVESQEVSTRVEEIIRHQFYILFSPVGAIFVYQLMAAAGMTSQPVTVALLALAAGVSMNLLLDKALEIVRSLFQEAANKREQKDAQQKAVEENPLK